MILKFYYEFVLGLPMLLHCAYYVFESFSIRNTNYNTSKLKKKNIHINHCQIVYIKLKGLLSGMNCNRPMDMWMSIHLFLSSVTSFFLNWSASPKPKSTEILEQNMIAREMWKQRQRISRNVFKVTALILQKGRSDLEILFYFYFACFTEATSER